jgi:hypothetical protein
MCGAARTSPHARCGGRSSGPDTPRAPRVQRSRRPPAPRILAARCGRAGRRRAVRQPLSRATRMVSASHSSLSFPSFFPLLTPRLRCFLPVPPPIMTLAAVAVSRPPPALGLPAPRRQRAAPGLAAPACLPSPLPSPRCGAGQHASLSPLQRPRLTSLSLPMQHCCRHAVTPRSAYERYSAARLLGAASVNPRPPAALACTPLNDRREPAALPPVLA